MRERHIWIDHQADEKFADEDRVFCQMLALVLMPVFAALPYYTFHLCVSAHLVFLYY